MAHFAVGNMWRHMSQATRIFVTTNNTLNARNELIMGRGAAVEATKISPNIAQRFGQQLLQHREEHGDKPYGILLDDRSKLGAFQVKDHWAHPAKLELIAYSTGLLNEYARSKPEDTFYLNFPGIGYGKLNIDDVLDTIRILPDNVMLWTLYQAPNIPRGKARTAQRV